MSTYNRHLKETKNKRELNYVLTHKYNGNLLNIDDAENDIKIINKLNKCSNKIHNVMEKITYFPPKEEKYLCGDIINDEVYFVSSKYPLLSYTLDYLTVVRILPYPFSTMLNMAKTTDFAGKDSEEKKVLQKIYNFVNSVYNTYSYRVVDYSINKQMGVARFGTMQQDQFTGGTRQQVYLVLDTQRQLNTPDIKGTVKDLMDSNMLFSMFSLFGFSKIYGRCTCSNFLRYQGQRYNSGTFICNHLMITYSLLPTYIYYLLRRL